MNITVLNSGGDCVCVRKTNPNSVYVNGACELAGFFLGWSIRLKGLQNHWWSQPNLTCSQSPISPNVILLRKIRSFVHRQGRSWDDYSTYTHLINPPPCAAHLSLLAFVSHPEPTASSKICWTNCFPWTMMSPQLVLLLLWVYNRYMSFLSFS